MLLLSGHVVPLKGSSPRYWRTPLALLHDSGAPETLEGERILAEYPDDRGVLLWQCYRDVRLWAGTPPELRRQLFHPTHSPVRGELISCAKPCLDRKTLRAVCTLQDEVREPEADPDTLLSAALLVAEAAKRVGAAATALAFTQLAAAVTPTSAGPTLLVGKLALRAGSHGMAEAWLRRAIGLGRRSHDVVSYGDALVALGQLYERSGRLEQAKDEYARAARHGRRFGLYQARSQAVYGLLRIALREHDDEAAAQYVHRALHGYRRGHPRRGTVLLDAAEVELRRNAYGRAAELLREALRLRLDTHGQVRAFTMLVRATGGADDRAGLNAAWEAAAALIQEGYGSTADGARLLLALACAGAEACQDVRADVVARHALTWARQAGEGGDGIVAACRSFLARPRLPA